MIYHGMDFHIGRINDEDEDHAITWKDSRAGSEETQMYVPTGSSGALLEFFRTCIYRAMFEHKYKASAAKVTEGDLSEFRHGYISPSLVLNCN